MKTTHILFATLVLVALLSTPALCEAWQVQRITNTSYPESAPRIWGDTVYFADFRSGTGDIYSWDPVNGTRSLIERPGSQIPWGVYQDRLVFTDRVDSEYDLYLYDKAHGVQPICVGPGEQYRADVSDQLVVWEDYRSGTSQIYAWDPLNGERPVSPASSGQFNPQVWGDTVVWEEGQEFHDSNSIRMWNPRDGVRSLGYGSYPDIYEDRVRWWTMWVDYGHYPDTDYRDGHLWEWTPQNGRHTLLTHSMRDVYMSRLWGDTTVYYRGNGPTGAGSWDPVNGTMGFGVGDSMTPSICGDKVAFIGGWDVYIATRIVPEPSGLLSLAGCTSMLGILLRRRR